MIKKRIRTPEGSYQATFGHFLPRLLGSDDVVIGGVAHFRTKYYSDNTLASPSPGHLAHAWTHVKQQREVGLDKGICKTIRAAWWWFRNKKEAEAEADAAAEENKNNPFYVTEWNTLRLLIKRTG